ncbi:MAG: copper homeostasis membrane protein CopD [Stellaceae bacterium]
METFFVAARTLHFTATISLTGVFAWECFIAGPGFHSRSAAAISAALYRQLGWLAWGSLTLALVSGAAWLAAVAASMSGMPLGSALTHGVWGIVLTRTQFGMDWLVRLGLAVLLAGCLLARRRRHATASAADGCTALLLAALLLASLAWAGHGAATPGAPGELHLVADILHLLAAGVWLGTLAPLALFLAAARREGDPDWAAIAHSVTRRFTVLAATSVAVLLAAGLVNTWFLAGNVPALVGTIYGRLLLAKIALFLGTLVIAAVNVLRLSPRLANSASGAGNAVWRTVGWLRGNALVEATLGLAVLAIVGALGILPPGLHTEPGWPFPYRVDLAALTAGSTILLATLAIVSGAFAVAIVAAAAAGRYRRMGALTVALCLCLGAGWIPLSPAVEEAYPTSFYTPAEPYSAASIIEGAALYAENCALCHGATGHGDGPAAAGLRIRPADLTEPHVLAHSPGDLFWWVSEGRGDGAMPGFATVLKPHQRWDLINFVRARAAGSLARRIGPQITTAAAPQIPDFAFEAAGVQTTLNQTLKSGSVLLVLFASPAANARLAGLAASRQAFARAGLNLVAIAIGPENQEPEQKKAPPPFAVGVSPDVVSALALFRASTDGGETELMLDRSGGVRARWTADDAVGLPDEAALIADARRVARIAVTAPSHAGHAQ